MFRRLFTSLAALAVSMTLLVSIAQAGTIFVTDALGRKIEVPANANRILLGFYFEDFYAIGGPDAYDKVVAISKSAWHDWRNSQWKTYVAANPKITEITDVGEVDAGTFSIETAIASKPDIAIIAAWQFRAMGDTVGKLEAAGIPVVVADYNAQTVKKHISSTLMIGQILGTEDRAQKLADQYAAAIADVKARVKKAVEDSKRVYVEIGSKGAGEFGNTYTDHMWGKMIALAGGKNIALGQVGRSTPLNPEFILAASPQAVFIAGSYWTNRENAVVMGFGVKPELTRERLMPYTKRPGWNGMDAVKSGNIHALYHGGARTLYDFTFLQYIAKVLYPQAFADIDPIANHRQFYETWLPVTADGVFMLKLGK